MKVILLIVSALALATFAKAHSLNSASSEAEEVAKRGHDFEKILQKLNSKKSNEPVQEGEPAYIQMLKKLYQGPPITPNTMTTRAVVATEWITQKLDHFDSSETGTWQMRYMVNDEYFKPGGPIFIYVGGEWEIHASSISWGIFVDMAKEHNGMLFYTEHRYYGESRPTRNLSTANLKYLHVKQALADLAHFIRTKRETNAELANSKVIMAGCSYAATMVVWFKKLYPELLTGGWASSGPILAQVDFKEYMEMVGKSFRVLGGDACYNRINNGIAELETMLTGSRSAEAMALLKLCNSFNVRDEKDIWTVFSSFAYIFAGVSQYQSDDDIPDYCDFLMWFEDDVSAVTNLWLWAYGYPTGCISVTYKGNVYWYTDTSYNNGWLRPWFYQTCNEYGWYQTSASKNQPFGSNFPVDLSTNLCRDSFGNGFTAKNIQASVDETNAIFGGTNLSVDNVYQTHGGLDPWSPMGHGAAEGATILPYASHCPDFGSISSRDTPEIVASKLHLMELVRKWLA